MAEGSRNNGAVAPPADALKDAGQRLLDLLVQRSAEAATQRVNGLTVRLSDVTDSGGDLRAALRRNPEKEGQASRPGGLRGTLSAAWHRALSGLQDTMHNIFGGGGTGAEQRTRSSLLEGVEVGLPLRTTYDAWTQFADFPSFNRVETIGPATDQTTNWSSKLRRSHQPLDTTIIEQVPDSRIVWSSTDAHGQVDGAVSFTRLGPHRTQVLLVLDWPQGRFARTDTLWPARARRVRLNLVQFHRRAMAEVLVRQQQVHGWRGEIRHRKVVTTHEQACDQEPTAQQEAGREEAADQGEPTPREPTAKDQSASDAAANEYTAAEQGEDNQAGENDQVDEDDPTPVESGRRG
jgi:hypothetical protein